MKRVIFIYIIMCANISFSQEVGKFRGGLDIGFSPYNSSVGNLGFLEEQWN